MRICILPFVALLLISGCTNDDDNGDLITSNPYYPLQVDKYIDYEVSETIYRNQGATVDTLVSYLREEIVSQRMNLSEEMEYVIDRYAKSSLNAPWNYLESWRVLFSDNQVLRIEDNRTFVKLNLPIVEGESWEGNAFFDSNNPITIGGESITYFKGWSSNYAELKGSANINGTTFEDIITVELADEENRIEIRKVTEQYALGLGLISKEIRVLDTQCFEGCENTPWEEKAESGHIFIQHIIDHN